MNERLMLMIAAFLNNDPRAIDFADAQSIAKECGISLEESVSLMLAAHCGLDLDRQEDAALYHRCFPKMLHKLTPAIITDDPYTRALRTHSFCHGSVTLEEDIYTPAEIFVCDDFLDAGELVLPQLGWFAEEVCYPALKENGRVWMTVTPNEINTIRPCAESARGKVLCYGLGMGYFVFHALMNPAVTSITVAERSRDVINLFRDALLPMFPRKEALTLVEADAFDYAANVAPGIAYDTVFADLWHDVSDGLPMYQHLKRLEVQGPQYMYWIEKTMKHYL